MFKDKHVCTNLLVTAQKFITEHPIDIHITIYFQCTQCIGRTIDRLNNIDWYFHLKWTKCRFHGQRRNLFLDRAEALELNCLADVEAWITQYRLHDSALSVNTEELSRIKVLIDWELYRKEKGVIRGRKELCMHKQPCWPQFIHCCWSVKETSLMKCTLHILPAVIPSLINPLQWFEHISISFSLIYLSIGLIRSLR